MRCPIPYHRDHLKRGTWRGFWSRARLVRILRLEALRALSQAGINVGVKLFAVLPGITDSPRGS